LHVSTVGPKLIALFDLKNSNAYHNIEKTFGIFSLKIRCGIYVSMQFSTVSDAYIRTVLTAKIKSAF